MLAGKFLQRDRGNGLAIRVAGVAAVGTAAVYAIPPILFAYPFPGIAIIASSLTSMSALAVCVLFALRHRRSQRLSDLVVASLFGLVALVEGLLPVLAAVNEPTSNLAFWSRAAARTIIGFGLCAAAWLPDRTIRRQPLVVMAAASLGLAVAAATWGLVLTTTLPSSVSGATDAGNALVHSPVLLVNRLAGMLFLLAAAIGFVRNARIRSDPVLDWLAAGAVLMGTARFHDFLFPSLHNDWVTTGDMLRLFGAWLILAGLLREVAVLWRRRGAEARAQERRALAAELHDGLAQELAYLTTQTALAELDPDNSARLARVRAAAERALNETRLRIDEYAKSTPIALDRVIAQLAHDVEDQYDCKVVLDLDEVDVRPRTAHELARVAREALSNAARHGDPEKIHVRLEVSMGVLRLSIADDGEGVIDITGSERSSFGLTSMRERAERLGGNCSIVSAPLDGTKVAIEVPQR